MRHIDVPSRFELLRRSRRSMARLGIDSKRTATCEHLARMPYYGLFSQLWQHDRHAFSIPVTHCLRAPSTSHSCSYTFLHYRLYIVQPFFCATMELWLATVLPTHMLRNRVSTHMSSLELRFPLLTPDVTIRELSGCACVCTGYV